MENNLLFLGTGAADYDRGRMDPPDFSDRSFRRCSCAILGGHVMLDCGPFAINSLQAAGIDPALITDIVFTHLHGDHFHADAVNTIARAAARKLNIWFRFDAAAEGLEGCVLHPMELFREYTVGGYKVTGVPANHEAYPQHLSIDTGTAKLFYGLDGAWFLGDTVRFMKGKRYDAVVLDATVGDYLGDYRMGEHNSIPMLRVMVPSMRTLNIVDDNSKVILSHLARTLHKSYIETVELTKHDGFIVAYDGYEIEI